jgi:hypothetical protein
MMFASILYIGLAVLAADPPLQSPPSKARKTSEADKQVMQLVVDTMDEVQNGSEGLVKSDAIAEELSKMLADAVQSEKEKGTALPTGWTDPEFVPLLLKGIEGKPSFSPFLVTPAEKQQFIKGKFDENKAREKIKSVLRLAADFDYKLPWFSQYVAESYKADKLHGIQLELGSRYLTKQVIGDLLAKINPNAAQKDDTFKDKNSASLLLKVSIEYPDASCKEVDDVVSIPLIQQIRGVEGLEKTISVSKADKAEIYLYFKSDVNATESMKLVEERIRLADPVLPERARPAQTKDVTKQPIVLPTFMDIHIVETNSIDIDREKVKALGIPVEFVFSACQTIKNSNGSDITFETDQGKKIKLTDIATIKSVRHPDCIIRTE